MHLALSLTPPSACDALAIGSTSHSSQPRNTGLHLHERVEVAFGPQQRNTAFILRPTERGAYEHQHRQCQQERGACRRPHCGQLMSTFSEQ